MDYEKKYKEGVEWLRDWIYLATTGEMREQMEKHFSELKESEDERIRKALIRFHKSTIDIDGIKGADVIAWLEKLKDEKKPADKVEPKFKVGDWVVSPNGVYWHIDAIQDGRYQVSSDSGKCAEWPLNTNIYHRFSIQDAKDGDVLCCESGWTCIFKALDNHTNTFSSYCFMDSDKWFCNTGSECHTLDERFIKAYNGEISPATKEQRDTLMKAMTDAGYTFDFEKKELENIEQNPAWSEEDECNMRRIIRVLEDNDSDWNELTAWLKSLRPQNKWKPAEEHMRHLWLAAHGDTRANVNYLIDLYNDLKKLTE